MSSTPVTVTVWGVFQLVAVNVSIGNKIVPSDVSLEDKPTLTSDVGSVFSFTEKVAVAPSSEVFPEIAETVIPAVSLSAFCTEISFGFIPA